MGTSPKLLVSIDYDPGKEPLEVRNAEGQIAYGIRLVGFVTALAIDDKRRRYRCTFEPIDHYHHREEDQWIPPDFVHENSTPIISDASTCQVLENSFLLAV
jgi:hypothetical protein